MKEQTIQNSIVAFLKERGVFYIKNIVTSKAGMPDIVAIHPATGQFIGIEVKAPKGVLSPLQFRTLKQIVAAGGNAVVARGVEDVRRIIDAD